LACIELAGSSIGKKNKLKRVLSAHHQYDAIMCFTTQGDERKKAKKQAKNK